MEIEAAASNKAFTVYMSKIESRSEIYPVTEIELVSEIEIETVFLKSRLCSIVRCTANGGSTVYTKVSLPSISLPTNFTTVEKIFGIFTQKIRVF